VRLSRLTLDGRFTGEYQRHVTFNCENARDELLFSES